MKNFKTSGTDNNVIELIKYGGNILSKLIYELVKKIWENEIRSEEWN